MMSSMGLGFITLMILQNEEEVGSKINHMEKSIYLTQVSGLQHN